MRKKKRITVIPAVLLAVILSLWQTVPSHAEPDMEEVTFPYEESSASRESILTGTIRVELISVSLPAGGFEFEVDTGGEFSLDNPGGQFGGSGIPITNRSMVPVQVEITHVAEMTDADLKFQDRYTDDVEQSFRLVDRIAKVGPLGTAILVMGVEGQTYQSAQASNYTITNKSKVPLKVSITKIETKSKDGNTAGPALVNTMNGLTGTNILFAVREKSETISYPAAASAGSEPWMMTTISAGSPYFVKGSTASTLAATGVADHSDELTMLLYGATGSGWKNGEGFQVIPTFLVETTS